MAIIIDPVAVPGRLQKAVKGLAFIFLVCISLQNLFCGKKTVPFQPTDELGIANKWVYDSMKLYYYWSDEITGKPDYTLPTQQFFKQLLSAHDRFSAISNEMNPVAPKSSFWTYGFHYNLVTHPFDAGKVLGVVTMVVPGSAAEGVTLKRGSFFTAVNGFTLTPGNVDAVNEALATGGQVKLQVAVLNNNGTGMTDSTLVTVQGNHVPVKSIHATRLLEKNGIKTGYLSYFLFEESQDAQLLTRIQQFKNAGISELVLDLRFNPGGSVASAAKLAAMLVPSFNPDQLFVVFKGNRHGGTVKQSFRQSIGFSGNVTGTDMNTLGSLNLGLKRIFILTSAATVSAAELLCNNLKPYMRVVRIGSKTYGKDEASFRIADKSNPRQSTWVLMPIVYKIFDANSKGDYSNGLQPDHTTNEFTSFPLEQLGVPGDVSLDKALQLIYGDEYVTVTTLRKRIYSFPGVRVLYQSVTGGALSIELKR